MVILSAVKLIPLSPALNPLGMSSIIMTVMTMTIPYSADFSGMPIMTVIHTVIPAI